MPDIVLFSDVKLAGEHVLTLDHQHDPSTYVGSLLTRVFSVHQLGLQALGLSPNQLQLMVFIRTSTSTRDLEILLRLCSTHLSVLTRQISNSISLVESMNFKFSIVWRGWPPFHISIFPEYFTA